MPTPRHTIFPPIPQTGRTVVLPPSAQLSHLMQRRVTADRTDLFATDPDEEIRTLGRLALRREKPSADDSFMLGDLCAQRSLNGDRLLILYVGKVLAAYRRAGQSDQAADQQLAARAIEDYVLWLITVAERAPNLRNIAAALWAAADWRPDGLSLLVAESYTSTLRSLGSHLVTANRKAEPTVPKSEPIIKSVSQTGPLDPVQDRSAEPRDKFESDAWVSTDADLGAEAQEDQAETIHDSSLPPMPAAPNDLLTLPPGAGASPAISIHQRIGPEREPDRYEISRAIAGGMGIVYLAYDRLDHRPVALKTTLSTYADQFEREAHTWIRLGKHPHIVQALTVQTIANQPFLILEYVGGDDGDDGRTDLRGWINRHQVDLKLSLTVALNVCWAMRDAVTRIENLVHRDLKPENLLITPEGITKVTDFGLALIDPVQDVSPTEPGRIAGTAAYLSPEQCEGQPLDPRSDMYALGVILYELVTGEFMYQAHTRSEWIKAHLTGSPRFPDGSILPDAVRGLILRLVARQRDSRYSDWASLAVEVADVYRSVFNQPPPSMIEGEALQTHEWMDTAYGLSEIGYHEEALAAYDQALAMNPAGTDAAWVWARKGRTLRVLGRYDEAITCFDQALALNSSYTWARNQRGITLVQSGDHERALNDFQVAADRRPGDPWPLLNQVDLLEKAGQYTEAQAILDRVLVLAPNHPVVQAKYGHLLRTLHRYPQALIAYNKALSADPGNTWYWYGKGITLKALDRLPEAVTAFAQAARADQDHENVWTWYAQAEVLIALGEDEEALGAAQQATRLFPAHGLSWARCGQVLARLRRYGEALAAYDHSIALDRKNAWAHGGRGDVLQRLRRLDDALAAYQNAAEFEPTEGWPWLSQGLVLTALQRPLDAITVLQHGAILAPNDPRFPTQIGRIYRSQNKVAEAIVAFDQALTLDNRYAPAWLELGLINESQGLLESALVAYEAASRFRPRDLIPLYNQAGILLRIGKPTEAIQLLDQVLSISPVYTRAWIKQAQIWRKLKDYSASLNACDRALQLAPHSTGALLTKGLTLQAAGRLNEALDVFEAVAHETPTNSWAWYNQAVVLIALNKPVPALQVLDRSLQLNPDHAAGWLMRSQALYTLGRYREALTACDSAISLAPQAAEYWYRRGLILERMERSDEALTSYERAAHFDPSVALYWTRQVSALLAGGQFEQALQLAKQVSQTLPDVATVWAELGYALRRADRHTEATEAYDRALALDPQYGWAWNGKGQALSALGHWEQALICFEHATQIEENDIWAWYNRAKALYELRQYDACLQILERALGLNKNHMPSRRLFEAASRHSHDQS